MGAGRTQIMGNERTTCVYTTAWKKSKEKFRKKTLVDFVCYVYLIYIARLSLLSTILLPHRHVSDDCDNYE